MDVSFSALVGILHAHRLAFNRGAPRVYGSRYLADLLESHLGDGVNIYKHGGGFILRIKDKELNKYVFSPPEDLNMEEYTTGFISGLVERTDYGDALVFDPFLKGGDYKFIKDILREHVRVYSIKNGEKDVLFFPFVDDVEAFIIEDLKSKLKNLYFVNGEEELEDLINTICNPNLKDMSVDLPKTLRSIQKSNFSYENLCPEERRKLARTLGVIHAIKRDRDGCQEIRLSPPSEWHELILRSDAKAVDYEDLTIINSRKHIGSKLLIKNRAYSLYLKELPGFKGQEAEEYISGLIDSLLHSDYASKHHKLLLLSSNIDLMRNMNTILNQCSVKTSYMEYETVISRRPKLFYDTRKEAEKYTKPKLIKKASIWIYDLDDIKRFTDVDFGELTIRSFSEEEVKANEKAFMEALRLSILSNTYKVEPVVLNKEIDNFKTVFKLVPLYSTEERNETLNEIEEKLLRHYLEELGLIPRRKLSKKEKERRKKAAKNRSWQKRVLNNLAMEV